MNLRTLSVGVGLLPLVAHASEKTNVLFIIADDLRPELSCYGNEHIVSPNIDQLASDGTMFSRAYVQTAVSAASRASFLTGCRPATTGVTYPYCEYFVYELLEQMVSLPRHFQNNGYYVRSFGKIHHGFNEDFSAPHYNSKLSKYAIEANRKPIGTERNLNGKPKYLPYECADVSEEDYQDGENVNVAIQAMKEAAGRDEPFFFAVGLWKPHMPFNAPKKYWDLYDPSKLPLAEFPGVTEDETKYSRVHFALPQYSGEYDSDTHIVSEAHARELRHSYFACISYVDELIGRLVKTLKEEGLYENTVIVLVGDHGWQLGDNGMWGKSTNFERSTRTPFIVKPTDQNASKVKSSDKLVEFVDIYPTVCELANVAPPAHLEGQSVVPLLQSNETAWKGAAFSEFLRAGFFRGYSIRTDRYRYTRWVDTRSNELMAEELYDHQQDPLETRNIAADQSDVCASLAKVIDSGWKSVLPEGMVNNSHNPSAVVVHDWGGEARNPRPADEPYIYHLLDKEPTLTPRSSFGK